jgi:hypothetical protein
MNRMLDQMFLENIMIPTPITSSGQKIKDRFEGFYLLGYIAM